MRVFVSALAISLLASAPVEAAPRRVASLNLCTDELLLLLARPEQVASVTHLSHDPLETPLADRARRHRPNDGSLASVAALAPDLILDMGSGARDSARIAHRLGTRILNLPFPTTVDDVMKSIALAAVALDRQDEGLTLLVRLARLRRSAPRTRVDAVWLGGGGRSLSVPGLGAQWMALAGFAQRRLPGDRLTLEQFLADPPSLLLVSSYRASEYSMEQQWLDHRVLRRNANVGRIVTDGRRWTCMGPLMIDEIARLRKAGPS